jgi:hypothetical protein
MFCDRYFLIFSACKKYIDRRFLLSHSDVFFVYFPLYILSAADTVVNCGKMCELKINHP